MGPPRRRRAARRSGRMSKQQRTAVRPLPARLSAKNACFSRSLPLVPSEERSVDVVGRTRRARLLPPSLSGSRVPSREPPHLSRAASVPTRAGSCRRVPHVPVRRRNRIVVTTHPREDASPPSSRPDSSFSSSSSSSSLRDAARARRRRRDLTTHARSWRSAAWRMAAPIRGGSGELAGGAVRPRFGPGLDSASASAARGELGAAATPPTRTPICSSTMPAEPPWSHAPSQPSPPRSRRILRKEGPTLRGPRAGDRAARPASGRAPTTRREVLLAVIPRFRFR